MDDDVPYYGEPVRTARQPAPQPVYYQAPPPKKRGWGGKILALLLVLILLFVLFYTPLFANLMNNVGPYVSYPEEAEFTVQRTVTLNGRGSYEVDYPEPFNMTNAQDVLSISFEGPPPVRAERYGVLWDSWSGTTVGSRETIVMRFSLHTYTLQWHMDNSGSVYMIPDELRDRYTGDEWSLADDPAVDDADRDNDGVPDVMIQPSAPAISSLAHNLTDDKPDVYSKAKAIYDYMHENFKYSTPEQMDYVQNKYGGLPKHSLATLRDGWGDCDEQSMLYISLLRAVGIPARLEMGMLYDPNNGVWGGHAWMQLYIPDSDGQGSWYNVDIVNSEFLLRDCNRITTWVDDGDGAHLSDYYHVFRGAGVSFSESLTSISYTSYGEVKVSTGTPPDLSMPGFGALVFISAASIAFILRKKR